MQGRLSSILELASSLAHQACKDKYDIHSETSTCNRQVFSCALEASNPSCFVLRAYSTLPSYQYNQQLTVKLTLPCKRCCLGQILPSLDICANPRHLPIERVDEDGNFAATSDMRETRFHKDRALQSISFSFRPNSHDISAPYLASYRTRNVMNPRRESQCQKLQFRRAFIADISKSLRDFPRFTGEA